MVGYSYGWRVTGWRWVHGPTSTLSPSFLLAQAIFQPNLFPYEYPNISQTQSFFTPTCLWRWNRQCSKTSAYKIQMPGDYPEESILHICPCWRQCASLCDSTLVPDCMMSQPRGQESSWSLQWELCISISEQCKLALKNYWMLTPSNL